MRKPRISEILELNLADRIRLVQLIWESIREAPDPVPVTDAERADLDRRLAAYAKDPDAGSPWPEVRKRLAGNG